MARRRFNVGKLLRKPDPWGLPLELTSEWEVRYHAGDIAPAELDLWLVYGYLTEVSHGGHEYWFGTWYASEARRTADALEAVGMPECAEICRRSFAVWPDGEPPEDFDERERVICHEWLEGDPDGVMPRLSALDSELYAAARSIDDLELSYRHILNHAEDFGLDPDRAPRARDVMKRMDEARKRDQEKTRREDERRARKPEPPRGPVPESVSFGVRRRSILLFAVPAAVFLVAPLVVPGGGFFYLRGVGLLVGFLCLRAAGMRWLFRVRMNPDGILVTGERGVPWKAIHTVRILSVAIPRRSGFEIGYTGPEGEEGTVRVPGGLEGGSEAYRAFLEMTQRHGSPWRLVGDLEGAVLSIEEE